MNQDNKPLGRGLEDVSHLFLSQRVGVPLPAAPRAGTVLLHSWPSVTKEHLAAMLKASEDGLEEGLRGLDAGVSCHPCGVIDLLAVDRANQLTIIDFDTTLNDGLLLRGIGHFDWLVRNIPNVRRMYRGQAIDFSRKPRLFLLAPQFSALLRTVAHQIARPEISWVRYHLVDLSGEPGILFEHVVDE